MDWLSEKVDWHGGHVARMWSHGEKWPAGEQFVSVVQNPDGSLAHSLYVQTTMFKKLPESAQIAMIAHDLLCVLADRGFVDDNMEECAVHDWMRVLAELQRIAQVDPVNEQATRVHAAIADWEWAEERARLILEQESETPKPEPDDAAECGIIPAAVPPEEIDPASIPW